jgi:hypothetical protein
MFPIICFAIDWNIQALNIVGIDAEEQPNHMSLVRTSLANGDTL